MRRKVLNSSELVQRLYRTEFPPFLRLMSKALFPKPILNEHIDVMSGAVANCLRTPGSRMILNAPPRSSKSFVFSIAMPAFYLARNPKARVMIVAGSEELARFLKHCLHELLTSDIYRSLNPHVEAKLRGTELVTQHEGCVSYVVVNGPIMGRGADLIVIDDPQTSEAAANKTKQEVCLHWIQHDLLSRLDKKSQGHVFLIAQRLAIGDLTERLDDGGWQKLVLKAVAERDESWLLPDGREWVRRKGSVLCPSFEDLKVLYDQLLAIKAMAFSAQYQQKPLASDFRHGVFFSEDVTNWKWTPDRSRPGCIFGGVPEIRFIQYELFGMGDPPPEPYRELYTEEQFEISLMRQQQKLIAACKGTYAR